MSNKSRRVTEQWYTDPSTNVPVNLSIEDRLAVKILAIEMNTTVSSIYRHALEKTYRAKLDAIKARRHEQS